jgi:DNA-binding transcriptional LysR family regulator
MALVLLNVLIQIMNQIHLSGSPLDSRQIQAFQVLSRTGSFTETAKALHLSQSAISHSMKALEQNIGCRLFDRVGKKALLNQAGEQFLVRVERILQEMNQARSELRRLGQWGQGRLRVSATPTACQYLLPSVLREFKESFPQCAILIEPGDTPQALDLLRQNRVDLALALEPPMEERITFRPLFSDELKFLVSPLHPWAKAGRVLREEISSQNYILYNKSSYTFKIIARYFSQESINLRSSLELGSMEAIKELVKLGLGVSILAPWIAQSEIEEGSLVAIPLGRRKLKRHWGLAYWQSRRLSLPEETFAGLCQSVSDNLPLNL